MQRAVFNSHGDEYVLCMLWAFTNVSRIVEHHSFNVPNGSMSKERDKPHLVPYVSDEGTGKLEHLAS